MDAYPVRTAEFQQLLPACGLSSHDLRLALSLDGQETTRAWLDARDRRSSRRRSRCSGSSRSSRRCRSRTTPRRGGLVRREGAAAPEEAAPVRPRGRAPAGGAPDPARHLLPRARRGHRRRRRRRWSARTTRSRAGSTRTASPSTTRATSRTSSSAVQDKVTAAYRVLSNEEKRRAYLSFLLLKFELTGTRRPGIDLDAEIALKKRGARAARAAERRGGPARSAPRSSGTRRSPSTTRCSAFAELFDPVLPAASAGAGGAARRAQGARARAGPPARDGGPRARGGGARRRRRGAAGGPRRAQGAPLERGPEAGAPPAEQPPRVAAARPARGLRTRREVAAPASGP